MMQMLAHRRDSCTVRLLVYIRNRFHPLFYLRKFWLFQRAIRLFDIPFPLHHKSISHPVYVSLSKNLGSVLTKGVAGEERERENFTWIVKAGQFQSFFDIGANVGLYGFLFGSIVGDYSSVTFIEPDNSNARLIRKTIDAAKLPSTLVQGAVSDHSGSAIFHQDNVTGATGSLVHGHETSFITAHHRTAPVPVSVDVITLDELCRVESPDFVKIDVEGAELSVLNGARRTLSQARPALMFECDQNRDSVRDLLLQLGYRLFDMELLERVDSITHNCLALHVEKHASLIDKIENVTPAPLQRSRS